MSRSKPRAAALIALCLLLSCAKAQDLIDPDSIKADEVKYNTAVAEYGTLARSFSVTGSEIFPLSTTVRYQGDAAIYVETLVKRNQEVKKGDVLMRVSVQFDPVDMAQRELELDRVRRNYAEALEDYDEAIEEVSLSLTLERDSYEKERLALRLKKLKLQRERAVSQYEYDIETRANQIDELNERHSRSEILSPIDGVIGELSYLKEGSPVYDGQVICTVESQDVMLILYKESRLRYGMEVELETGPGKNRVTTRGHVVAASDCLRNVVSEYSLVEVDDPAWREINWRNTKATADYIHLENVLLVDRKAVLMNGGKYIVTRLADDGVTQKRFVNQGLFTTAKAWIVQGLEAGDVLIID